MSTIKNQMPGEIMIPGIIYFNNTRINVKIWPKSIQLTCPSLPSVKEVFKTLEEYDQWWHDFKKKNPDAYRKDIKYVKTLNGLFLIQKRLYQKRNPSLS